MSSLSGISRYWRLQGREWHPPCFLVGHKSNDAVDDGDSACDPRTASHIREQAVGLEDCCVIRREAIKSCRQVEKKENTAFVARDTRIKSPLATMSRLRKIFCVSCACRGRCIDGTDATWGAASDMCGGGPGHRSLPEFNASPSFFFRAISPVSVTCHRHYRLEAAYGVATGECGEPWYPSLQVR